MSKVFSFGCCVEKKNQFAVFTVLSSSFSCERLTGADEKAGSRFHLIVYSFFSIQIIQTQKRDLSALTAFKQRVCKSAERENIKMILAALAEYVCIMPENLEFIHANLLIAVFTRADTYSMCRN